MMITVTDLPNEILSQVFELVREDDSKSLLHCLFVNWKFSVIARPIFYEHVCLHADLHRKSPLSSFLANTQANNLVRSLTIPVISDDVYDGEELEQIAKFISSFHRLETFSVNLQDQGHFFLGRDDDDDRLSGFIPDSMFGRMLQALPFGVTNLELDLEYWNKENDSHHLCHEIGNLLPQLRTLRLHIHRICTEILHQLTDDPTTISHLRLATIRLYSKVKNWQFCKAEDLALRRPPAFAKAIHHHHTRGAFPWLRHFYVYNTAFVSSFNRGHHIYSRVRDIATNTSLTVPARVLGELLQDIAKPYIFRDETGRDFIGTGRDMSILLERPIQWTTLSNGSRIPPTIAGCADEERKTAVGEATVVDPDSEELPPGVLNMMFHLWNRERVIGMATLWATKEEGLESEESPHEMLPDGYEFFQSDLIWSVRKIGELALSDEEEVVVDE